MKDNVSSIQSDSTSNRLKITMAWVGILSIFVPIIILRLLVPDLPAEPSTPIWLKWAQLVFLAVLCAATWLWSEIRPLRGFFLALLAFIVGDLFLSPFIYGSTAWSKWVDLASWGVWVVALFGVRLLTAALMAFTLVGSGIGRKELFLIRGDPRALAEPTRLMLGALRESKPWDRVAREFLPVYVIIVVVVVGIQVRPDLSQLLQSLIYLPAIIIAAAINAFVEEFEFRSVLLSRLGAVFGSQQAIFMTAALFGLGHYYGWPGGPFGVVLAAYLGWWAAKSMIETRGFVWAFALHFLGDVIVYAFWAMAGFRI